MTSITNKVLLISACKVSIPHLRLKVVRQIFTHKTEQDPKLTPNQKAQTVRTECEVRLQWALSVERKTLKSHQGAKWKERPKKMN